MEEASLPQSGLSRPPHEVTCRMEGIKYSKDSENYVLGERTACMQAKRWESFGCVRGTD